MVVGAWSGAELLISSVRTEMGMQKRLPARLHPHDRKISSQAPSPKDSTLTKTVTLETDVLTQRLLENALQGRTLSGFTFPDL